MSKIRIKKTEAENTRLKRALKEIRLHEERCRRKGIGFDAYVFAVADKALEDVD